jgi:[phosphatase 2A protein]-leucine-carboxy methyltransferase
MSAASIPNLLISRGSRGSDRGRGRLRGRGGGAPAERFQAEGENIIVQGTDTDAAVSRLSAVELGYLQDPFAKFFVTQETPGYQKRLPIINRGTYTRTAALDKIIDAFLTPSDGSSQSPKRQVVSLGAGTDTRSLRLFSKPELHHVSYHEIDFEEIVSKKLGTVQTTMQIRDVLPEVKVDEFLESGIGVWTARNSSKNQLRCHGLDLRRLAKNTAVDEDVEIAELRGLESDVPTMLLSECCLCYLQSQEAAGVMRWFTSRMPHLAIVIYEPTKPDDAFGRQMVSNLAARNIRMPSLDYLKKPEDQANRLREAGMEEVRQQTIDQIWDSWVSEKEKERVDGLEGLDEVEEWKLLAGHYIVAWGWRGRGFDALAKVG